MKENDYSFEHEKSFEIKTNVQKQQENNNIIQSQKLNDSFMSQSMNESMNEQNLQVKKEGNYELKQERLKKLLENLGDTKLTHVPKNSALMEGYGSVFKPRYAEKVRAAKLGNKRSRLYKKKQIAATIEQKAKEVSASNYAILTHNLPEGELEIDRESLMNLSAFMSTENIEDNKTIVSAYAEGDEENINKAMELITADIMSEDVSDIRIENDKAIAENAKRLERLALKVEAYDRLTEKHADFLLSMDEKDKRKITGKLKKLRAVAAYYNIRREIVTDPIYIKSYNDELSMDFTTLQSEVNTKMAELGKKLLMAYILGVNLMEQNGMADIAAKLKKPVFEDEEEGNDFMEQQRQRLLQADGDKKILKEHSKIKEAIRGTKGIYRIKDAEKLEDKNEQKALIEKAKQNMEEDQGSWHESPDYKDKGYIPQLVKGYVEQLEAVDISEIKTDSYRQMIMHYKENNVIFEKVDRLWYEIARALEHGYRSASLDDDRLMELRAKANTVACIKRTATKLHADLIRNPDKFSYSNEDIDKRLKTLSQANMGKNHGLPDHLWLAGDPIDLLNEWRETIAKENATKEKSIKEAYFIFSGQKKKSIPKAELKQRMDSYNANAIIQDYLCDQQVFECFSRMDMIAGPIYDEQYAEEKEKEENNKKQSYKSARMNIAMTNRRSSAEIKELAKLQNGSPQDMMDFYGRVLSEILSLPLSDFNVKKGGSLLDNYFKKKRIAMLCVDLDGVTENIKKLIKDYPDTEFKLPCNFKSVDEIYRTVAVYHYLGGAVMSPRFVALTQLASNRWLHGYTVADMGYLDEKRYKQVNHDAWERKEDDTEYSYAMTDIARKIEFINQQNKYNPEEIYNFDTDAQMLYERLLAKYDEDQQKKADNK